MRRRRSGAERGDDGSRSPAVERRSRTSRFEVPMSMAGSRIYPFENHSHGFYTSAKYREQDEEVFWALVRHFLQYLAQSENSNWADPVGTTGLPVLFS